MALRELEKGEEVLVMFTFYDNYKKGDIGTVSHQHDPSEKLWTMVMKDGYEAKLTRDRFLAVGDKVTRGPDWDEDSPYGDSPAGENGSIGVVVGFNRIEAGDGHNVGVDWPNRKNINNHRMTPDHQDLAPVGDSEVGAGEGKDEDKAMSPDEMRGLRAGDKIKAIEDYSTCWNKHDILCITRASRGTVSFRDNNGYDHSMTVGGDNIKRFKVAGTEICGTSVIAAIYDECTNYEPIEENDMSEQTREQRAVAIDKDVENMGEALSEYIAQQDEVMTEKRAVAADLRLYKTDKAKKIGTVVKARNADGSASAEEQAEAIIWCSDNEITL